MAAAGIQNNTMQATNDAVSYVLELALVAHLGDGLAGRLGERELDLKGLRAWAIT